MKKYCICKSCGEIIDIVIDKGESLICCDKPMQELVANTTDAATEKHVPVISVEGNTVKVDIGEVEHPMLANHYIEWIEIETTTGSQRKMLKPSEAPRATFILSEGEKLITVYEYCGLHGLWKKDM